MRPSRSEPRRARSRIPLGTCLGAALVGAFLVSPGVRAQSAADSSQLTAVGECCMPVRLPLGARVVALGGAVAADTDADMTLSNPAGLVGLHRAELLVHYRKFVEDGQILGLSYVSRPLAFGTFAASYTLVDYGSVDATDPYGNDLGTTYSQVHLLAGTFATPLGAGVSAGLTYKVFIWVTPGGTGFDTGGAGGATQMLDFGVQYHPRWERWLAAGAAVVNAGLPLQAVNYRQADRTPIRERAAVSYEFLHLLQKDTTVAGSIAGQVDLGGPNGAIPAVGVQATFGGVVAFRAGWRGGTDTGDAAGAALGVGLKLQRFTLSVARTVSAAPLDAGAPPFHVTFGMSF